MSNDTRSEFLRYSHAVGRVTCELQALFAAIGFLTYRHSGSDGPWLEALTSVMNRLQVAAIEATKADSPRWRSINFDEPRMRPSIDGTRYASMHEAMLVLGRQVFTRCYLQTGEFNAPAQILNGPANAPAYQCGLGDEELSDLEHRRLLHEELSLHFEVDLIDAHWRIEEERERFIRSLPSRTGSEKGQGASGETIPKIDHIDAKILLHLAESPGLVRKEVDIAVATGSNEKTIRPHLRTMMTNGFIRRPDGKKQGYLIASGGQERIDRLADALPDQVDTWLREMGREPR